MFKRLIGKFSLSAKKSIAVALSSAFIVATCSSFTYAATNIVTIADADKAPLQIKTTDTNVGKILSKQGVVLNEGDQLNYDLSDEIRNDAVIKIYRAQSVTLTYMGETKTCMTTKNTVAEFLEEQGISTDGDDYVSVALDSKVDEGMEVTVILYDNHNVTVQEEVAYRTIEQENPGLAAGQRNVLQAGQVGINEFEYNIQYENGIEIARTLVRETTLSTPTEEIVEYGPENVWQLGVVPASAPTRYSKVETFQATAYDASPADNGIWAGKTSTGMPLVYGVVAVDPRVIPYGTKMYIESVDGKYVYGYAIAGDCGGAIKGNRVDLFFPSRSTCYNFGRRDVRIYFLD